MTDLLADVYPILLAGGTGTRLWPVSRELYPKQLVNFTGNRSLVQATAKRLVPPLAAEKVRLVCGREHVHEIARHMEEIGIPGEGKILTEPCGRNTAPAILLALLNILNQSDDPIICVFPADHVIRDIETFHARLKVAVDLADQGFIVTFGIQPDYPETGYGYIQGAAPLGDGARIIERFVEKPDRKTAQKYLQAGNFYWNSGMFTFRAAVMLEEFRLLQPALLAQMQQMGTAADPSEAQYRQLPDISIDYAIMEATRKGAVLASDFGWSDIGSWKSLYDFLPKDPDENVLDGDIIANDTRHCFVLGHERLIATNHLKNVVVVETPDSIFVSDLDRSRDVKSIVTRLKEGGRVEYHHHRKVHHPWGSTTLLEHSGDIEIKRLVVFPDRQFDCPTRPDAWQQLTVISGQARMMVKGQDQPLLCGQSCVLQDEQSAAFVNPDSEPLWLMHIIISGQSALDCKARK